MTGPLPRSVFLDANVLVATAVLDVFLSLA